jgi:hypothetical protein
MADYQREWKLPDDPKWAALLLALSSMVRRSGGVLSFSRAELMVSDGGELCLRKTQEGGLDIWAEDCDHGRQ